MKGSVLLILLIKSVNYHIKLQNEKEKRTRFKSLESAIQFQLDKRTNGKWLRLK